VKGLICSSFGGWSNYFTSHWGAQRDARRNQSGYSGIDKRINWETQAITDVSNPSNPTAAGTARPNSDQWLALAETAAEATCRASGARYVDGSAAFGPGHSNEAGSGDDYTGTELGWFLPYEVHGSNASARRYQARQSRTWTATCKKVVRRTR